jgi:hypothetical protein
MLDAAINESEGFSFALLRKAYIMAAQTGFDDRREMSFDDLLDTIWACAKRLYWVR